MTRLCVAWSALVILRGLRMTKMGTNGGTMEMSIMEILRKSFRQPQYPDRYKRFEIAKRNIPMNLKPYEYEQEIRRLARKYKI
jgi:hypothetical protein